MKFDLKSCFLMLYFVSVFLQYDREGSLLCCILTFVWVELGCLCILCLFLCVPKDSLRSVIVICSDPICLLAIYHLYNPPFRLNYRKRDEFNF